MHFLRALGHIPAVKTLFFKLYKANLLPDKIIEPRRKQLRYADEKIAKYAEQMAFMMTTTNSADRRLNTDATRPDFLQKMISVREKQGITVQDLKAQASLLTIAGSETTATALAGITYYLCRTPQVYDNLAREIREAFSSYQQINGRSIEPLPYLRAVIEEGLRIYPPVPIGLPRLSPGATVDGHYVPRRTVVYVTSWAATTQREKFPPTIRVYPRALVGPEL
jgi:cytochrome P450